MGLPLKKGVFFMEKFKAVTVCGLFGVFLLVIFHANHVVRATGGQTSVSDDSRFLPRPPQLLQDSDDDEFAGHWTRESLLSERQRLANELFYDTSDIVLFCFGVGNDRTQAFPSYFINLARQFSDKKFKIIVVEPLLFISGDKFGLFTPGKMRAIGLTQKEESPMLVENNQTSHRYNLAGHENLEVVAFATALPSDRTGGFYDYFKKYVEYKLDQAKLVFWGFHLQARSFADCETFARFYKEIKTSHANAQNLQLYLQGGLGMCMVYDPINVAYKAQISGIVSIPMIYDEVDSLFTPAVFFKHLVDMHFSVVETDCGFRIDSVNEVVEDLTAALDQSSVYHQACTIKSFWKDALRKSINEVDLNRRWDAQQRVVGSYKRGHALVE